MATTDGKDQAAQSEDRIFALGGPTVPLVLGGISKPIRQLPARKNEEWKRELAAAAASSLSVPNGKLDNVDALARLFSSLGDLQVDLVVAYDVDGRLGGKDWILDNATPSEIWEAFKDVLKAAFPFLADAQRAPALVAELLPHLAALAGSKPSAPGA